MLDPRERFAATADAYQRHRPSYPSALIDWILRTAALTTPAVVADLGCGTGISTRLFAARGFDTIGVDPNEEMLARARGRGEARYRIGEAAATGLGDASVDLVTVGQALHWFDIPATLAEFRRILRPAGWCAAFWNLRADSPLLREYEALLRRHSREYDGVGKPEATVGRLRASEGVVDPREAEFGHAQVLDRDGLFGRARSSSYVAHGVEDREALDRALAELFDRHQQNGRVEFRYRTIAVCWRISPSPGSFSPGPVRG